MRTRSFSCFYLFYIGFLGAGGLLTAGILLLQQMGISPERCIGDWKRMYECLRESSMVSWNRWFLLGYLTLFRGGLALGIAWAGRYGSIPIRNALVLFLGIMEGCGVVKWFITAGGQGILLHILIQFPHMIFYVLMGSALFKRRFRRGALLFAMGVLTECYVNSFLLQLFFSPLKK